MFNDRASLMGVTVLLYGAGETIEAGAASEGARNCSGSPMLRKTYDWVMGFAASPRAPLALGAIAFCEGLFFPIPPDVLLMPVVLGDRQRALRYALLTTVFSIAGGAWRCSGGLFLQPGGGGLGSRIGC